MNYTKQARDFLEKTETELRVAFVRHGTHFVDDKETRDVYECLLFRGDRMFKFEFGNSIVASCKFRYGSLVANDMQTLSKMAKRHLAKGEVMENKSFAVPTAYDVLTCLQKHDVGTFKDFCSEFGYDEDSRKAEKIFRAVVVEYGNVRKIWSEEEIELLREIQ
jgi:hypothetical protein